VKRIFKGPWLWIVIGVVGVLLALQFLAPNGGGDEIPTSEMQQYIAKGQVKEITFIDNDQEIRATLDSDVKRDGGDKVVTHWVNGQQNDLIRETQEQVDKGNIEKYNSENPQPSLIGSLLATLLPFALIILLFIFLMNSVQGGGGRVMQFAKSRAKLITKDMPKTTFADVAGCDEAIEELSEIKEFLQEPAKFQAVGAKIPKGVLLYGQPGTGKTLLARAVAGEAGVPFYSISGSDFVEMFVGVGASRVRDLFEQAKENAPAIVFIDEIDAVGRHRGAGMGGGHDEREQTLNQLLVEMDGFDVRGGVILIAATNRPDVLDPALLRPGRFDRQVVVPLPDIRGREQILLVHMRKVPIAPDVDANIIARGTPGMSGADLANLVNEAALFAARRNKRLVDMLDFEEAKDKIFMGAERKSMVITPEDKKKTAYHESGHAIIGMSLPGCDPVHKVTVIPRGRALGVTWALPEQDRYSMYKDEMLANISMLFGGRVAEELFVGNVSTGASNDFERATHIARDMVTRYGMSDALGPMVYGENEGEVFVGRSITTHKNLSDATMQKVDSEIRRIIDEQYSLARKILDENRDKVETMTKALLEWETLDHEQILDIMAGRPPRPPKPIAARPSAPPSDGGGATPRPVEPNPNPTPAADA
jgi:cell division protease FtsH